MLIIPHPHLGVPSIPDEFKLFLDRKVSTLLSRNSNIWLSKVFQSTWRKNRESKGCCLDTSQCHTVQNKSSRLLELAWCMPAPALTKASGPALPAHLSQSKWSRNQGPKNPTRKEKVDQTASIFSRVKARRKQGEGEEKKTYLQNPELKAIKRGISPDRWKSTLVSK